MARKMMVVVMAGLLMLAVTAATATAQVRFGEDCPLILDAYGPGICDPDPPVDPPPPSRELPFTGGEAGIAGGIGLVLLLGGVAMRRAARFRPPPE